MEWNSVLIRKWMSYYELAKKFYEENGHLTIPHDYMAEGLKLGVWMSSQRESYQIGRLSEEQIDLLNSIGNCNDKGSPKDLQRSMAISIRCRRISAIMILRLMYGCGFREPASA